MKKVLPVRNREYDSSEPRPFPIEEYFQTAQFFSVFLICGTDSFIISYLAINNRAKDR